MIITLYDILGISSTASSAEIKAAYKTLAKQYHPDKNPGSVWHEEQFKKINQAYQILSDPSQRRIYDYRLEYERFNRQRPVTPNPSPKQQRTEPQPRPNTKTQHTYQKKKAEPQYQKPPALPDTWLDKFFETIFKPIKSLSEKKINMYVVSYYCSILLLLGLYYKFLDNSKTNELFRQAELYSNNKQYYNAISTYNAILNIDEANEEAYEKRAFSKMKIHWNIEDILADLNYAIENTSDPSDSLLLTRAKCYIKIKKYQPALADLDHILLKEDEEGKRKIDSAHFHKAEIYFDLQQYDSAIYDYTSFIKFQPESGEAHNNRAYCFFSKKKYKAAIYDFNFCIQQHPENAKNYYYRAFAKFSLKDSTNGCKDLHDSFLLGYNEAGRARNKICGHTDHLYQ